MKKKIRFRSLLFLFSIFYSFLVGSDKFSETQITPELQNSSKKNIQNENDIIAKVETISLSDDKSPIPLEEEIHDTSTDRMKASDIFEKHTTPKNDIYVSFDLQGKSLYDVILALSELKKINILIPASLEAEKVIINFSISQQILLEEVEEYLIYFINMAGYILTLQGDVYIVTKKIDDHIRRYNLPLYVNIKPEDLPDNAAYIRLIYFFKHIKVPLPTGRGNEAVKQILLSILPDRANGLWVDSRTNSMVITGPSNAIAAALLLIEQIDNYGEPDYIFHLPMQYINATYVQKLIEDLLAISKESNPPAPTNLGLYNGPSYFSPHMKMVLDARQNAIIFMGKHDAIVKLVAFIKKEVDIPEAHGKCLVHVYNLQYLDSKKIAPILQDLVNGTTTAAEGDQSIKDEGARSTAYRKFDNVRIIPEEIVPVKRNTPNGSQPTNTKLTLGGNRLIISANKDDYQEIEKIIKMLDTPQPQIIVEVVILDLQYQEMKNFSSDTKLPSIFNLPIGAQVQSLMWDNSRVMMSNPDSPLAVTNVGGITPLTTMNTNLLTEIGAGVEGDGKITSLINNSARNGLIISLGEEYKNSNIWSILQLEESISRRNLIENPTVITQNNTPAKISNIVVKRGAGALSPNNTQYGGATVVNIDSYTASLGVTITPHISFGSCQKNGPVRLSLEISMAMEDFKNDDISDFTKFNRNMRTNANLNSGDILILGGLHKESHTKNIAKVPFLGDIPLIGSLFRKTVNEKIDSNLVFCVRATIIESEEELQEYTRRQTNHLKSELTENAFAQLYKDVNRIRIEK